MPSPIFIPIIFASGKTTVCDRCGLNYPEKDGKCTHCTDLSDLEVLVLQEESKRQRKAATSLGVLFLVAAGLFSLVILANVL